MNKTGIVIILLCFLAAAAVVLWERRKTRKTMEEIERMLDAAMTGSFSETNFDESQLSALETKFAHYTEAITHANIDPYSVEAAFSPVCTNGNIVGRKHQPADEIIATPSSTLCDNERIRCVRFSRAI